MPRLDVALLLLCASLTSSIAVPAAQAQPPAYLAEIGWTQLQSELGSAMPTGKGVVVSQVEHRMNSVGGYAPQLTNPDFTGKFIALESGASVVSQHATHVGERLYGVDTGVAPGVTHVDAWESTSWSSSMLRAGTTLAPAVDHAQVENESWKGTLGNKAANLDTLRRFDYMIDRDRVTAVVAAGNEDTNTIPILLASNYNAITVGISAGTSNSGLTSFDGSGRVKPDLVAPEKSTSLATPLVSGAATLLLQTADNSHALSQATNPEVVKAILLAGATQSQFATWHHTATEPLDLKYGAGQLDVEHSYNILTAGEKGPGSHLGAEGWDFAHTAAPGSAVGYSFAVTAREPEIDVALTWDRTITSGLSGGQFGDLQSSLANLDLKLYRVSGGTATLVDESISTVDNVEFLVEHNLAPGSYRLYVDSDTAGVNYGLAWYTTLAGSQNALAAGISTAALAQVPEPSSAALLALAVACGGAWSALRRARRRRSERHDKLAGTL